MITAETKTLHLFNRGAIGDLLSSPGLKYAQPSTQTGRADVNAVTPWNAPLVWEGTFDPVVVDDIYKSMNPRIAVLALAVGRYTQFLKGFLESGEKYFFVGFRVTYYIFTDRRQEVPNISLGPGRSISVHDVPTSGRWQDVVFSRMERASVIIEKLLYKEADYLFMMDIDSLFHHRFGAESLSRLTAVLHRLYYKQTPREGFPYEFRPESEAYIPLGAGDYYYTAAVWGGYMEDMYKLVKYFLYNKPTKVLSPEYLWSDYDGFPPQDIRVVRVSQLMKNYTEVRPNGGR